MPGREVRPIMSVLKRRIAIVLAIAALCGATGGCVSDMVAATSGASDGRGQMRYYGGPKSPMWRAPAGN